MPEEQKRLFLAVIISIVIIVLTNKFFMPEPPQEPLEQAAITQADTAGNIQGATELPGKAGMEQSARLPADDAKAGKAAVDDGEPTIKPEQPARSRKEVLADDARINIHTPAVRGSIRLKGARIDDLKLQRYKEDMSPDSGPITLLSPVGTKKPYYIEFGWVADRSTPAKVPGPKAQWTARGDTLAPGAPVKLTWDNGEGLIFVRTLHLDENYMFTVSQHFENNTDEAVTLYPYGLISRFGTPENLSRGILHEGMIGVFNESLEEISYSELVDTESLRQQFTTKSGWVGITDKYWLTALVFDQTVPDVLATFTATPEGDTHRFQADYRSAPVTAQAGSISADSTNLLFSGAKRVHLLDQYKEEKGIDRFDLAIDFGWYYFLTKPFFYCLDFLFNLIGNMGLAILLFAGLLRLMMFPVANKSYVNMSKMKKLQPKVKELNKLYAEDRVRLNQEMMALYKKEKVNPAAGCLPMFIQIPVFFSLYKVLYISIEMRHAPFYGWINDLSAPDPTSVFTLFGMINWPIPDILNIGVWPLVMGITMFLQQKLNPKPADDTQAKLMLAMPLVFTFMLGQFAAGLVIYWTWSNFLSIIQQRTIMKKMGVKAD